MDMSRNEVEKHMEEIVYGYECPLCRLTDHGVKRLSGNGFTITPCKVCQEHFEGREQ